jgi:hypothetical protein
MRQIGDTRTKCRFERKIEKLGDRHLECQQLNLWSRIITHNVFRGSRQYQITISFAPWKLTRRRLNNYDLRKKSLS